MAREKPAHVHKTAAIRHTRAGRGPGRTWIPACAGMTKELFLAARFGSFKLLVITMPLLCACASIAQQETEAIVVNANAESHAELVQVVSKALNTTPVTIADDALTRDSFLTIERKPARDPATGQRLSGRDFDKPEHFRLVRQGDRCVLVHERTGERYTLSKTSCKAK
jgi:hypothetical protein